MRFQMKLLLAYSLFIVLLVLIMGGIFYKYSIGIFQANAYSNITLISDKMSQQFDNIIHPMDFKTTELLSDQNFMSSLTSLATINRDDPNNQIYINNAIQTIYSDLITYSIDKNFYRVSVFNNKGDFLSSNFRVNNISGGDLTKVIDELSWKKTADEQGGKLTLIPPYIDPWANNGTKVFSVVRSIQWPNSDIGYIEIQEQYSVLEKIFSVPDNNNTKVIATLDNGKLIYSNGIQDESLLKYYSSIVTPINGAATVKNVITHKEEIVTSTISKYTGMKIVIAQDKAALFKPLLLTAKVTLFGGILIIGISFIYIYIISERLTRPIRQLKEKIENTELENLPDKIIFDSSHNEFELLNNSFQLLRERLNLSVGREIKSQSLQMRANFDSLQAQVNPHFIYNILNVLSNKGIETGDDEICEICDSIAAMLRYSTSTVKRSTSIEEEIEHVRNYLMLMKKRYEYRLEFNFNIEGSIYNEAIPKMVLQPIVENAVNLNFEMGIKVVKIEINGYIKDGWWYIEIMDNGKGFQDEELIELERRMEVMKNEIIKSESKTGLDIGGMGLINTYGRLLLFYKKKFVFILKNSTFAGAIVLIGGIIGNSEEEI